MEIRLATQADVKSILPLFRELDAKHYRKSVDVRSDISDKRYLALFDVFFSENSNLIITVAEKDDIIVAFALSKITIIRSNLLFKDSTIGEILYLAVEEKFKRNGIGIKMMEDMEKRLIEKGSKKFELRVFAFNDETLPEKIDYKPKYTVYEKFI